MASYYSPLVILSEAKDLVAKPSERSQDAILIGVARQRHRRWGSRRLLERRITLSCKVCQ